jgi:hypothetical protein
MDIGESVEAPIEPVLEEPVAPEGEAPAQA